VKAPGAAEAWLFLLAEEAREELKRLRSTALLSYQACAGSAVRRQGARFSGMGLASFAPQVRRNLYSLYVWRSVFPGTDNWEVPWPDRSVSGW
jgi:hypothetical protein